MESFHAGRKGRLGRRTTASPSAKCVSQLTDLDPVIAPATPLRGLTSDADFIRSVLQTLDGSIVLVGHSYGDAVISIAARGVDNVAALFYIAAFAQERASRSRSWSTGTLAPTSPPTH